MIHLNFKLSFFLFIPLMQFAVAQSPVASYRFNGNANDLSGNNNHGILGGNTNNPVLTTDRFNTANSAYEFGGFYNQNWIRIPDHPTLTFNKKMSVSIWFKQCDFSGMNDIGQFDSGSRAVHCLISKAGDGYQANPGIYSYAFFDPLGDRYLNFANRNPGTPAPNFSEFARMNCFTPCAWTHYAAVIDSNEARLYLNGKLVTQSIINVADFTQANLEDFWIGRMYMLNFAWYPFNGAIDDIDIFNYALNQTQIDSLFGGYVDPLAPPISLTYLTGVAKPSLSNGAVRVNVSGGEPPYLYSLDNLSFQASNTFTSLALGTYQVYVTDNNGCTRQGTFTIDETNCNCTH